MTRSSATVAVASLAESLVDESPDGLIALSPDGTILSWNRGAETIFGFSRSEAIGRTVEELIVPGDLREEARSKLALALAQGTVVFETTRRRKDGSFIVVAVSKRVVTDEAGQPIFIAVNKKDLTSLRHERAFDAKFRSVLEAAPDAMVIINVSGRILIVNAQVEKIFGHPRDELLGRSIDTLLPERYRGGHSQYVANYFLAPTTRPMAARASVLFGLRKDGTEFAAEISLSPVDTQEGLLVMAAIRDVTERKQIELALRGAQEELERRVTERTSQLSMSLEKLRASEARFHTLSTSGIVGIVVADVLGNIHDANDSSLRMFGYTRAEIDHSNWFTLIPPDRQGTEKRALEQLTREGVAHLRETEMLHKDGHLVPVLLGAAMLDPVLCIAFIADITERKRVETSLRKTEDQLRQAQKMEAVGRLAGGIAHDFNNALSVILSYAEVLLSEMTSQDPIRADIQEIRMAGVRAADLTRQLLMFSRQQVLAPKVLDLNDVLGAMHKMLARMLGADVDLVSLPGQSLGTVRADQSSLEQAIMNLVVNARDAMPTGGKLTMETANIDLDEAYGKEHLGAKPGPHVMLAVTDTGTGIDKANLPRVFEPFFTTKESGRGTGLGLSTVLGIVQQSGGSVWVYSELGHGTTFKIYLPRVDAAVETMRPSAHPVAVRGSETILLVEDDDPVRGVVLGILRKHGYRVLEARHAKEALLHSEQYPDVIHLLLTDVVMPEMSGPELAKRLARTRPNMKVLCMSGYTDDSIVRHGVLEAHIAFLQKPITPETITRRIREVLDAPLPRR